MTQMDKATQNRLVLFLQRYHLSCITAILLAASLYFFLGATTFKKAMNSSAPEQFETGQIVHIVKVKDGDEILISNPDGAKTVLRVIGIQSFAPTISDPQLSEYGKICFNYLKGITLDQDARLEVSDKVKDNEGRLLGSLYLKDADDEFKTNVALDLVSKGYSLVYTRFSFPAMDEYLRVQDKAKQDRAGLWSNPTITSRAEAMINMWTQERRKND